MKNSIISLFVLAATLPLFARDGVVLPPNLGDGEPGLCLDYNSKGDWVVFVDESLKNEWKQGDEWNPQPHDKPIKILAGQNIQNLDWWGNNHDLFPFDENTVFTCDNDPNNIIGLPRETRVFSTNGLVSRNVDTLAHARYGLGTNQWFLGKIGTNIFYNETGKPNVVYFRTAQEKFAVNYFRLPRADNIIWGVKKALDANKDVGFCVDWKIPVHERWTHYGMWAPTALPMFIELSLEDARHRKIPKHLLGIPGIATQ